MNSNFPFGNLLNEYNFKEEVLDGSFGKNDNADNEVVVGALVLIVLLKVNLN